MLLHTQVRAINRPDPSTIPIVLVFLHYFGGSSESWRHVGERVKTLCPNCVCVALDLRGHGQSPDAPTHTVAEMAGDVRETLAGLLEISDCPLLLVGHSMGGKVALQLAASGLPQLRGLVLVAPSPPGGEPMTDAERGANLRGWGDEDASRQTLNTIALLPMEEPDKEQFIHDRARTTRDAWYDWFENGSREDISPLMNRIQVPTVVLSGENDSVIPSDIQRRETLSYLHDAFLSVVPRAGHLLPYEAPAATAEIISSCLSLIK